MSTYPNLRKLNFLSRYRPESEEELSLVMEKCTKLNYLTMKLDYNYFNWPMGSISAAFMTQFIKFIGDLDNFTFGPIYVCDREVEFLELCCEAHQQCSKSDKFTF